MMLEQLSKYKVTKYRLTYESNSGIVDIVIETNRERTALGLSRIAKEAIRHTDFEKELETS